MADGTGAVQSRFAQVKSLRDKFIHSYEVEEVLKIAVATGKNVILFGAGGHAKSEMVETALQDFKPFVQTFGEGMTEERFFGGLEMKLFQEQGQIKYQTQNSFMAHEVVVFEEFFDAPTNVLLSAKDILTSKQFRNGSQSETIKTKVVIACTNRTPEEVGEDLSSKALLERFPLKLEVKWNHYTATDFQKLFVKVLKTSELSILAEICEEIHLEGGFISPRTAIHAGEVVLECGWSALKFIDGIDGDILKKVKELQKRQEKDSQEDDVLKNLSVRFVALANDFQNSTSVAQLLRIKQQATTIITELSNLSVKDKNLEVLNKLLSDSEILFKEADVKVKTLLRR